MTSIAFFDARQYEIDFFKNYEKDNEFRFHYIPSKLTLDTAHLSKGCKIICCFVRDSLNKKIIEVLARNGVEMIALRCTGFNNLDIMACKENNILVARVPDYSPYAIAEHALSLLMSLNRKIHKAYNRTKEHDFSLDELVGFELHAKTIGVMGTGRIGAKFVEIMLGIGSDVIAYDPFVNPELEEFGQDKKFRYVSIDELYANSDAISLHLPLTDSTYHIINDNSISKMKKGVYLINTARGGLIDTMALIRGLKSGRLGAVGLDVYEYEDDVFFENLSNKIIKDDLLVNLLGFHNVIMTSHQSYLTRASLDKIAQTTVFNINQFLKGEELKNEIVEKRKYPRHSYESGISISSSAGQKVGTFISQDLSLSGMFIKMSNASSLMSSDNIYNVTFPMKYSKVATEFEATAKVVRVQENGVALAFDKIDPPFDDHLKKQVQWLAMQNDEKY